MSPYGFGYDAARAMDVTRDTPKRRRSFVWMIRLGVALIAIVLVAEGAARWLEEDLPSGGDWPEGSIAEQVDVVAQAAEHAPVDVVFAGSSMTEKGFDPIAFSRRTGMSAVNAALPASTNALLGPWLLNVVVPMTRPKTVVIGVASRDFNDNASGPEQSYRRLVDAPGYRRIEPRTILDRIDATLGRFSALVRRRRSLRSMSNVIEALKGAEPSLAIRGCPPKKASWERYARDATVSRYPLTLLRDYHAGGPQTSALVDTIRALRERGTGVVLVKMAATDDYVALHHDPRRDLAAYDAAVARVVRATRVPLVDATFISDHHLFRDQIHLNCAGAAQLTGLVVDRWASLAP